VIGKQFPYLTTTMGEEEAAGSDSSSLTLMGVSAEHPSTGSARCTIPITVYP
jgi:hypothetical protein